MTRNKNPRVFVVCEASRGDTYRHTHTMAQHPWIRYQIRKLPLLLFKVQIGCAYIVFFSAFIPAVSFSLNIALREFFLCKTSFVILQRRRSNETFFLIHKETYDGLFLNKIFTWIIATRNTKRHISFDVFGTENFCPLTVMESICCFVFFPVPINFTNKICQRRVSNFD